MDVSCVFLRLKAHRRSVLEWQKHSSYNAMNSKKLVTESSLSAPELVDQLLFESPRNIPAVDFGMSDPNREAKIVYDLVKDRRTKVIDTFQEFELKKCGHTIFAMDDSQKLIYFVNYTDNKFSALPGRHVTQIAVRRRSTAPSSLASYVFWKHLFPIRGTIMSDSQQSKKGKYFWGTRIREAFQRRHLVFRVNVLKRLRTRLESTDDYEEWLKTLYGPTTDYEHERLVITDTPLPESRQPVAVKL